MAYPVPLVICVPSAAPMDTVEFSRRNIAPPWLMPPVRKYVFDGFPPAVTGRVALSRFAAMLDAIAFAMSGPQCWREVHAAGQQRDRDRPADRAPREHRTRSDPPGTSRTAAPAPPGRGPAQPSTRRNTPRTGHPPTGTARRDDRSGRPRAGVRRRIMGMGFLAAVTVRVAQQVRPEVRHRAQRVMAARRLSPGQARAVDVNRRTALLASYLEHETTLSRAGGSR